MKSTTVNQKIVTKKLIAEAVIETEEQSVHSFFSAHFRKNLHELIKQKQLYMGGSALVIGSFMANVLNYIFNAYLGRVLSFEDFALIGLIGGFLSLSSILFGAYTFTVNYSCSFLIGKHGDSAAYSFWKYITKKAVYPSLIIAGIWLSITPFLMNFFHTNNVFLFILFSVVLLVGFMNSINQGYIASKLLFGSLAILSLVDPIVKLSATFGLTLFGLQQWAFATMVLSFSTVFLVGWLFLSKSVHKQKPKILVSVEEHFSNKLFLLSLLSGFSAVAYFAFDIFLAKHFLSSTEAGKYVLISLVGKMVFFLGSLTSPFITPLVSRYEGAKKNSLYPLYAIMGITTLFAFVGFVLFGVFGYFTVPLLYGAKAHEIVPYLLFFTFGMACYTISTVLVNYYLVKKVYSFIIVTSLLVAAQVGFILVFHDTIGKIALVMSFVLMANLLVTLSMHFSAHKVMAFEKSLSAYFDKKNKKSEPSFVYTFINSIQRTLMKGHK